MNIKKINFKIDFGLLITIGVYLLIFALAIILLGGSVFIMKSQMNKIKVNEQQNIFKFQANTEGNNIRKEFLLNNQSFKGLNINNISKYDEHFLEWEINEHHKYITLLNKGVVKKFDNSKYNFYNILCSSIQKTQNNLVVNVDLNLLPEKRTYNDIDENLDCIYDGNSFKIIYALDKIIKR